MVNKRFLVTVLDRSHGDAVAQLRQRCYALSSSFSWFDKQALTWTTVDDNSVVLGVLDRQAGLAATVRASIRPDRSSVEALLSYSTVPVPSRFPALVGSRSATETAYGKHGLAAVMRSVIVGQSKRLGLSSITGVVYDDAPRVRSMLAQGYEFYKPPEHWDCEARLAANPIIISMPASAFSGALQTIEAQAGEAIATCEFDMKKIVLSFNQEAVRMRADFEGRVANSLDGVKLRSKPVAS